jgi:hypothetical protein
MNLHFRTFRLQPPSAPPPRQYLWLRTGFAPDSLCIAIGGHSDFVHSQQSRQSHQAVSSLCRNALMASLFYGLSVHFQLLSTPCRHDAVTFSYPAGSSTGERLSLSVHAHSQAHWASCRWQDAVQQAARPSRSVPSGRLPLCVRGRFFDPHFDQKPVPIPWCTLLKVCTMPRRVVWLSTKT